MLDADPATRITLAEIKNHPYVLGQAASQPEIHAEFTSRYNELHGLEQEPGIDLSELDAKLIEADIQELFEFLVTVIHHFVLKGNEQVLIDNEHYRIQIDVAERSFDLNIYSVDEAICAL